ncbi:MAG TPA: phosphatidylinositol mannoside acyltransferase [Acidimicrobiia bacterium]|nr:phosphatidylinositol mannoside acyltransferase [Acidimicrobiia bacterium]HEV3450756.1 phosphatidylinositol mannoside acyltransferase [Acidimicrobiia bacterium]
MPGARARAVYAGYRVAADVARVVPPALGELLARSTAWVYQAANPARRRQVARNLDRVAPAPLDPAARRRAVASVFDHYGRYFHELFRLSVSDPAALVAGFACEGKEHVAAAAALGRGVVMALPHLGNWDLAGAWLVSEGYELTVVAEPVEPPELFDWFVATRERLGMRVVALGPDSGAALLRDLHAGRVVALVCDRDISGDGVPVDFFGERTRLPGGPAALALRTGAPLLPVGCYFRPRRGHEAHILEPLATRREARVRDDVARVTQQLAHRFEELIRAAPDQWLLMQPNWPSDAVDRS